MKQENYKEIAWIMSNKLLLLQPNGHEIVCNKLADYFERESSGILNIISVDKFNKKQFLKDCGIN